MHILIIANNGGGLLNFRQEVVRALLDCGNRVTVAIPRSDRDDEIRQLGCEVVNIEISRRGTNPITDINLTLQYIKLIRHCQPNVVLTYTIKPNIYGGLACRITHTPYIANITGLGSAVENGGILQKITAVLYRIGLKKASCIFFQNRGNYNFFNKNIFQCSLGRLIPGSGANLKKFSAKPFPTQHPTIFLFISRIMKEKGIDDFLAAAKHFKQSGDKDVEFHVIGMCEENYVKILNDLHENGIIVYHGRQKDVRPFIEKASCLIHPTFYPEGMSNVILEAASTGRPVITTRRYGCMEAVDENVTGFLFEERNRQELFQAIEKFLKMSCSQQADMGAMGRKKMEKEFDRQIVVDAYLDEISKITNKDNTQI